MRAVLKNIRLHLANIKSLAVRGLSGRLFRAGLVLAANFVGISTAVLTFGLFIAYIKYQVNGIPVVIKGFTLVVPDGAYGLLLYALLGLLLGIISAACTHSANLGIFRLARDFHLQCMRDALIGLDPFATGTPQASGSFLAATHDRRHIATVYAIYTAIAFRIILEAILPLLASLVSVGVLLYVDPWVTVALLPLTLLYVIPYYRLNRFAAGYHRQYMNSMTRLSQLAFQVATRLMQNDNPDVVSSLHDRVLRDEDLEHMMDAFYGRQLIARRTAVLSQVFLTIAIVLLFVLLGLAVAHQRYAWASILTYLIALRFAGRSLQRLATLFISLTGFLPAVRTFADFTWRTPPPDGTNTAAQMPALINTPAVSLCWSRDTDLMGDTGMLMEKGKLVGALVAGDVTDSRMRAAVSSIQHAVDPASGVSRPLITRRVLLRDPLPGLTLAEQVFGRKATKDHPAQARSLIEELGLSPSADTPSMCFETEYTAERISGLTNDEKYAIDLLFPLIGGCDLIALRREDLNALSPDFRECVLERMKDLAILVVADGSRPAEETSGWSQTPATSFLVIDGEQIIAGGDEHWLAQSGAAIVSRLADIRQTQILKGEDSATLADADLLTL